MATQPDAAPGAASHDASLTDYVAGFVVGTRATDIPADVMHLGKRSVIDGLGLALAGAASETSAITRRYLASLGIASNSGSTVKIGRASCRESGGVVGLG